jgi:hypothetical protein
MRKIQSETTKVPLDGEPGPVPGCASGCGGGGCRCDRIDATIVDALAARTIIAGHYDLKDAVVALPNPVATNMGYLAFSKDANRQSLLADFDAALAAMRDDGSFETILSTSLEKNATGPSN